MLSDVVLSWHWNIQQYIENIRHIRVNENVTKYSGKSTVVDPFVCILMLLMWRNMFVFLSHWFTLSSPIYEVKIAKFMWPTWGPLGSCRPQVGPILASWALLSRMLLVAHRSNYGGSRVNVLRGLLWYTRKLALRSLWREWSRSNLTKINYLCNSSNISGQKYLRN